MVAHLTSLSTRDIEQKGVFSVCQGSVIYGQLIIFSVRKEPQEVTTF